MATASVNSAKAMSVPGALQLIHGVWHAHLAPHSINLNILSAACSNWSITCDHDGEVCLVHFTRLQQRANAVFHLRSSDTIM